MQIVSLISQDHMNNNQYVGKADILAFRAVNQHGFLVQLQEKKLCAVILLPSQTLLLSVSAKARRLIGMLFPGVSSSYYFSKILAATTGTTTTIAAATAAIEGWNWGEPGLCSGSRLSELIWGRRTLSTVPWKEEAVDSDERRMTEDDAVGVGIYEERRPAVEQIAKMMCL
ncbi:hypothetical protein R6Q57_015232 [Mikania cordata]